MEITCTGDASYLLQGSRTVAINPQQAERGMITLFSRRQRNPRLQINGPGEYEIGDVLIATVPIGPYASQEWAHAVRLDEINVLYLDGDAEALTEEALLAIGPVDVLILAAGNLPASVKAVQDLGPRLIIPFGAHAAELCAALGVKDAAPINRVNVNGKTPRAVLLKPRRAPTRKRPAA